MEKRRDVFQAIADPTRREILSLIAKKPLNLNSIAENFDMSRPAVSQHIKVLDESGLVVMRKKGRQRFCYIRPQKMKDVDQWLQQFRQLWEDRFDQLDQVLTNLKDQDDEE
ncbi:transcriptional regulator, ArsR family [Fodinibius roseus]|uniref:Transcriptional regulator, ArsR family n=1 Tax=Fodinibius roseus TaxID=1194090 RepID=A0A1M5GHK9_9BACT|nr:metalloregulator ArsR/SmtB family transcription factor [Fodinibius roseus]SHG03260.1 transcriptional regulator, ArsR family [Fodinibius roseus]